MRVTSSRLFLLAATAVLLASALLALRVALPPWKRIQRERIDEQIQAARQEVDSQRAAFAAIRESLDYLKADEAWQRAIDGRDEAAVEISGLDLELDQLHQRRAELLGKLQASVVDDDAAAEHASYVRLTGTPGATREAIELQHGRARAARGADLLDELDLLDEQRRELEDRRDALQAPARASEEALVGFRDELDRAEARLDRLEAWPIEVHEICTPAGDVERCTTCHPGMDDPATHKSMAPTSPFVGWGCTPCHGGNGRALTADDAHRHLTLRPWTHGGEYSLEPVIAELESNDPGQRAAAAAFLRRATGRSFGYQYHTSADERAGAVARWRAWWAAAAGYYHPARPAGLVDHGFDAAGRPRSFVGSGACLRCHEARQRQHVQRWSATKFTSFERLEEVEDPRTCLPCHTTGYDKASGEYLQPGVTCEGCHGPGAGYSSAMQAAVVLQSHGEVDEGERLLDDVSTQLREQMAQHNVCVDCHDPFGVKELAYEHRQ